MSKQFTLGKNERLKSRKQIEQLFDKGKSFVVMPFRIYYLIGEIPNAQSSMSNVQFGVGVSAKNFKRAVDRNRIKRLAREAWRLQKNDPIAMGINEQMKANGKQLNVFFIYSGKELPEFTIVKDKVAVALKKLSDKIDENISSNS